MTSLERLRATQVPAGAGSVMSGQQIQAKDITVGIGVVACLAALAAMGAPYVLISEPGTGLPIYYGAGPLGAGAVAFLAVIQPIVLLSGTRGRADPATAAGVAVVVGFAMLGIVLAWAFSVPRRTRPLVSGCVDGLAPLDRCSHRRRRRRRERRLRPRGAPVGTCRPVGRAVWWGV